MKPETGTVPLVYPCHFNGGTVHWPKLDARKPNAILDNDETRPWLVRSGIYLLTKRFTSKEERRRIIVSTVRANQGTRRRNGLHFLEKPPQLLSLQRNVLDRRLAVGLFVFLNSTVVDQYFRRFSGHTQVNATDLRKLPYPDRETLRAMGSELKELDQPQDTIDQLVPEKHFDASTHKPKPVSTPTRKQKLGETG